MTATSHIQESRLKVFLSYHFPDEQFVARICYHLKKQPMLDVYFYADDHRLKAWQAAAGDAVDSAARLVLFLGSEFGKTQADEAVRFADVCKEKIDERALVICLHECQANFPSMFISLQNCRRVRCAGSRAADAIACAKEIATKLTQQWYAADGLPVGYPFDYEKAIIDAYVNRSADQTRRILEHGCADDWPDALQIEDSAWAGEPNPVSERVIGADRKSDSRILVDVRSSYPITQPTSGPSLCSCAVKGQLTFAEAGPRNMLRFPGHHKKLLKVGVLVSGGIAPGINAVISGIVQRHVLYHTPQITDLRVPGKTPRSYTLQVFGFRNGFAGLLAGDDVTVLYDSDSPDEKLRAHLRRIANRGGSEIGTSRYDDLLSTADPDKREKDLDQVAENLANRHFDILYVIGGDGSMRAAHATWKRSRDNGKSLSVIGVPKTMDNDILWVWQSFGFLSAVEKAREALQQLHTEATSNPRLCVVQLFGSDSGFVVSHAALASGVCDAALIPEVPFTMKKLADYITERLSKRFRPGAGGQSPYGMIVMAETAVPQDAEDYLSDPEVDLDENEKAAIQAFVSKGCRVHGQTPDELRTGGLKVVSRVLQKRIREMKVDDAYWADFRVFTNEPRHLLRAIPPSASDVAFGQRLGVLAVDNAMAGYTDFMISQWMTEYVLVPLDLVVLGRKRVPPNGIFWKSVVASTGQPPELV
jgi:6-phosphofructokinase 1